MKMVVGVVVVGPSVVEVGDASHSTYFPSDRSPHLAKEQGGGLFTRERVLVDKELSLAWCPVTERTSRLAR